MVYPLGRSVTCIAPVLFNGGDRETNEWQSQNKRLVASSPIIQLNAPRDWINGSSCGCVQGHRKNNNSSEAKFMRRLSLLICHYQFYAKIKYFLNCSKRSISYYLYNYDANSVDLETQNQCLFFFLKNAIGPVNGHLLIYIQHKIPFL